MEPRRRSSLGGSGLGVPLVVAAVGDVVGGAVEVVVVGIAAPRSSYGVSPASRPPPSFSAERQVGDTRQRSVARRRSPTLAGIARIR